MGSPFKWWWRRRVKTWWWTVLVGVLYVGSGVRALDHGYDSVAVDVLIGSGCLFLILGLAALAYSRRHPLPPREPWDANLYP